MSDLSQVESSLASLITQVVYPDGTANPSITGTPCKIYRGWPIPANLDKDLAAGTVNISIFPNDNEQVTTRYPKEWKPLPFASPTLTLAVSGVTITVGGTPSGPLNVAAVVNGIGYVYPVQPGDTDTSIATGLASLIDADTTATSSGPVITIPYGHQISANAGAQGTLVRETKRQRRGLQVTFWCPNPAVRDLIVGPVDAALADVDFLALPDGTAGRLVYERSRVSDRVEREGLYRRDLFYSAEYGTIDSMTTAQIVAVVVNLTDAYGGPLPLNLISDCLLMESGAFLLLEAGGRIALEG